MQADHEFSAAAEKFRQIEGELFRIKERVAGGPPYLVKTGQLEVAIRLFRLTGGLRGLKYNTKDQLLHSHGCRGLHGPRRGRVRELQVLDPPGSEAWKDGAPSGVPSFYLRLRSRFFRAPRAVRP